MRQSTKEDQGGEQHRERLECQVLAFAEENPDCDRDCEIGAEDENVGGCMHGDEPGLPQEAIAVRHVGGTIDHILQHCQSPLFAWRNAAKTSYLAQSISRRRKRCSRTAFGAKSGQVASAFRKPLSYPQQLVCLLLPDRDAGWPPAFESCLPSRSLETTLAPQEEKSRLTTEWSAVGLLRWFWGP